jgi:hypothetical protein
MTLPEGIIKAIFNLSNTCGVTRIETDVLIYTNPFYSAA